MNEIEMMQELEKVKIQIESEFDLMREQLYQNEKYLKNTVQTVIDKINKSVEDRLNETFKEEEERIGSNTRSITRVS